MCLTGGISFPYYGLYKLSFVSILIFSSANLFDFFFDLPSSQRLTLKLLLIFFLLFGLFFAFYKNTDPFAGQVNWRTGVKRSLVYLLLGLPLYVILGFGLEYFLNLKYQHAIELDKDGNTEQAFDIFHGLCRAKYGKGCTSIGKFMLENSNSEYATNRAVMYLKKGCKWDDPDACSLLSQKQ